jgi:hypothetical protein
MIFGQIGIKKIDKVSNDIVYEIIDRNNLTLFKYVRDQPQTHTV